MGRSKLIDVSRFQLVQFIKIYSGTRGARSADRLRSYLKQLFAYGVELGYVQDNPMHGVTKRVTGYVSIARNRTLTPDEIRAVWSWKNNDQGWQKTDLRLERHSRAWKSRRLAPPWHCQIGRSRALPSA